MAKQKGGTNWLEFHYTNDSKRLLWIESLGPHALTLIDIIPKINWSSFKYKGPIDYELDFGDNNTIKTGIRTIQCESESDVTYEVFGGAACELWGLAVPEIPIRTHVDFTGDIDVMVSMPKIKFTDAHILGLLKKRDPVKMDMILLTETGFTPYGEQITHWLYDEVVKQIKTISHHFNSKVFRLPDASEHHETEQADLQTPVGNFLVCRVPLYAAGMIKIQIAVKVVSRNTSEMGHVMEFVMTPKGSFDFINNIKIRNINVEDPLTLLYSQIEGLVGRGKGMLNTMKNKGITRVEDYPTFYKFDNHCGRLLYLASLQQYMEGKTYGRSPKPLTYLVEGQVLKILTDIYKSACDKICSKHFGTGYINELIEIFESMKYIGKGKFTTNMSGIVKQRLNAAKKLGQEKTVGGRHTRHNAYKKRPKCRFTTPNNVKKIEILNSHLNR
jgi:hypothetical protein